jgi:hypothetical protein
MGILRADRITGLGGANAIDGSTFFAADHDGTAWLRYIDAGISDDFNFGTGDFTVECWINRSTLTNDDAIWATTVAEGSSSLFWYFNSSGQLRAYLGEGTSERLSSSNNIVVDKWYHIALTRASGTVNMWVDGVSKYSASNVTANIGSSTQNFIIGDGNIGYNGNAYMFLGHISNLRIQKGKAEYTAAFTPPTTRLAVTPETVLLACHDPGNVLAEATGKKLSLVLSGATGSNSAGIVASRFTPNSPVGFSTTTDVGSQYGTTFEGFGSFSTSTYMVPPGGNTRERNRGRAVFGGGQSTSYTSAIQIFNIQSQGNTIEVGELSQSNWGLGACGSSTRGLFGGGRTAPGGSGNYLNTIEFVTIANAGNSSDFGDLTRANSYINALGNQTRGIWAGGYNVDTKPATNIGSNTIDYVTIATAGNAADFGDMVRQDGSSDTTFSKFSTANSTRGLLAGGYNSGGEQDEITYITIATTGNSTYFGDLTAVSAFGGSGASSSTRGILTVGGTPGPHNRIDFVTIATTGNATDFGDLTLARRYSQGVSNKTRAVFITGYTGSDTNLIDFVTIATTGNATDFGDNDREDNYGNGATSDSHGGLS